jgi:hypothetical protein
MAKSSHIYFFLCFFNVKSEKSCYALWLILQKELNNVGKYAKDLIKKLMQCSSRSKITLLFGYFTILELKK